MQAVSVLAGIAWDPQIRGFLAVLVGVVVLCGSVYLLLGTNLANRLGFMVALTGLAGWMVVLGLVWWVFGIGMMGQAPQWSVREINFDDLEVAATEPARDLDMSVLAGIDPNEFNDLEEEELEQARLELEEQLGGWEIIPEADPTFGEANATVADHIEDNPLTGLGVERPDQVLTLWAFERGGKSGLPPDPNRWDRIYRFLRNTFWEIRTPPIYAIVQVQPVVPAEAEPGQPPPTPEPDPAQPVISYVLIRDLGDVRFPAAMVTLFSAVVFGVLCHMLHRRDERVAEVRGLAPATTT